MDFSYVNDWLNLIFRWAHLVFGAAWIGASFYFNWLNNNLRPAADEADEKKGVGGELWSVHGGHFYRVLKYQVAPEELPKKLHWFKWEAYLTWATGMCLLAVVYYLQADLYLIDRSIADISQVTAVGIGLATLVGGWLAYHFACKTALVRRPQLFFWIMFAAVTAVAFGLSQVFNPRAAYIHVGALLGTCMALNVFFVIIPNQRVMVDDMLAGKEPDPQMGIGGAVRSLHNNYMTLPVLFIMLSNHFPMTFGSGLNWAILAAISIIGIATRHWFNLEGKGIKNHWLLPVSATAMVTLAFVMSPYVRAKASGQGVEVSDAKVAFAEANQVIMSRCVPCHTAQPTFAGIVAPPKGIVLTTPEQIKAQVATIKKVTVDSKVMPLGNLTQMTDAERAILGRWIGQGAPLE